MKIPCSCGEFISDSTDCLRGKGHLTPDQKLYDVWDGMDDQLIDKVASASITLDQAYNLSRTIMASPTRTMWQCCNCGRLYIEGFDRDIHCFVPEGEGTDKAILRGSEDS